MCRAWPPSRTVICSPSSAERSLARFGLPLRRPFGLPDCPGLNRVALGGLRYPTAYSLDIRLNLCSLATPGRVRLTGIRLVDRPLGGGFAKRQTGFGVFGRNVGNPFPAADRDIAI